MVRASTSYFTATRWSSGVSALLSFSDVDVLYGTGSWVQPGPWSSYCVSDRGKPRGQHGSPEQPLQFRVEALRYRSLLSHRLPRGRSISGPRDPDSSQAIPSPLGQRVHFRLSQAVGPQDHEKCAVLPLRSLPPGCTLGSAESSLPIPSALAARFCRTQASAREPCAADEVLFEPVG